MKDVVPNTCHYTKLDMKCKYDIQILQTVTVHSTICAVTSQTSYLNETLNYGISVQHVQDWGLTVITLIQQPILKYSFKNSSAGIQKDFHDSSKCIGSFSRRRFLFCTNCLSSALIGYKFLQYYTKQCLLLKFRPVTL